MREASRLGWGSVGLWKCRCSRHRQQREGPATELLARPRERSGGLDLGDARRREGAEGRRLCGCAEWGAGAGAGDSGHCSLVAFIFSYKVEEKVPDRRPIR